MRSIENVWSGVAFLFLVAISSNELFEGGRAGPQGSDLPSLGDDEAPELANEGIASNKELRDFVLEQFESPLSEKTLNVGALLVSLVVTALTYGFLERRLFI